MLRLAVAVDPQHGALVQLREPVRYESRNGLIPQWNRIEEWNGAEGSILPTEREIPDWDGLKEELVGDWFVRIGLDDGGADLKQILK